MKYAIAREVSPLIVNCELTHLDRVPIDFAKAQQQHKEYCQALKDLGLKVIVLEGSSFPDGVFVEDPAVIVDEFAVITRMAAKSRHAETEGLAQAISEFRQLRKIQSPGTLDGGDVLRIEKTLYVGLSTRTNQSGFEQLRELLSPLGYQLVSAPIRECLHLKTACTYLGDQTVLLNPKWVNSEIFNGLQILEVDPQEPFAANALLINRTLMFSTVFPRTLERIRQRGFKVCTVDNSELMKAESALTCMSQVF